LPLTEPEPPAPSDDDPPEPSTPPPGGRSFKKLVLGLVAGALCLFIGGAVWFWLYPDQPGPVRTVSVTVEIPAGAGLLGIKKILAQAGVIHDDFRFFLWAKLLAGRRLKAGEYAFAPGMSPRAVISLLASGKTVPHAITVVEGFNLYQTAEVIQAGGWGRQEEFWQLVTDPGFINSFGLQAATLEGYLFPDTYFFEKGTGLRVIVTAMVKRMVQVLDEERAKKGQRGSGSEAEKPALIPYEVLILASIIEKETALAAERPLVAKVFLNRLRLGMKLQTDPTVIYGLAKFGAPLTKDDLDTSTPFNTYANRGLPVGPICNPGRTAIAAALNPAADDYTYFVSQNDGSHYFSKSLSEHNQAVARYRKKREAAQEAGEKAERDN